MPRCGSQIVLCNLPIRFDTYRGCSHACSYCFVKRKSTISDIKTGESPEQLKDWMKGRRIRETQWCEWDIPMHWGGASDPFQPVELQHKRSFECLKIFADTGYPLVLSTKAIMPLANEDYFNILKNCNLVYQVSMVSPKYDKWESGAPSFNERLGVLSKASSIAKRLIIRVQPYTEMAHGDVLKSIPKYCDSGVYGITIEGMKKTQSSKSFIKFMGDWVYPVDILKRRFKEIKQCAHDNGLKFFSAENRLRSMGDSLTCCGCEGLDGFNVFKGNLNQFRHDKANYKFDKVSQKDGSGYVFKALRQDTIGAQIMMKSKFKDLMDAYCKDSKYQKIVGYSGD